jgi:formylglycine-generating enzyme required for sulfatase activity
VLAPDPPARRWKLKAAMGVLAVALLAAAIFVFTATPVRIEVEPAPEQLALRGGVALPMPGGRYLLWPGRYTVRAERAGYAVLEEPIEIRREGAAEFRFELALLPDVYSIRTTGLDGARVLVDGVEAGLTPLAGLELPAGRYEMRVEAEHRLPREMTLVVEGGGREVGVDIDLEPDPGERVVESSAPGKMRDGTGGPRAGGGARADCQRTGRRRGAGRGQLPRRGAAGTGPAARTGATHRAPQGRLSARHAHAHAGGRGRAAAHRPARTGCGRGLASRRGCRDGRDLAGGRFGRPQSPRRRRRPRRRSRPGFAARRASSCAHVPPGRFSIGASRREPGRRANENLREVELTRGFYIAVAPVTNAQFRAFDPAHRSGEVGRYGLNGDRHPVVRVRWEQAVAYCNWLSEQEGLPAAYRRVGESWEPVLPRTGGYRLPTEVEWAWAARYAGRPAEPPRYPWGGALPPPERSGNYADESARDLLGAVIPRYEDGFAVTSPVGSFPPNALGLHDVGGNVAEWIEDFYGVYPPSEALLVDPQGPASGRFRVIRGSSWMHHGATELRLSYRDYGDEPRPDLGFRIARDLE